MSPKKVKTNHSDTPTVSENSHVSVVHAILPSNCTVYYIYETQGAERPHEADHIAQMFTKVLNEYLKTK